MSNTTTTVVTSALTAGIITGATMFGSGFFDNCYSVVCQVQEDCENYVNNPSNNPNLYDDYKTAMTNATGNDYHAICANINYP